MALAGTKPHPEPTDEQQDVEPGDWSDAESEQTEKTAPEPPTGDPAEAALVGAIDESAETSDARDEPIEGTWAGVRASDESGPADASPAERLAAEPVAAAPIVVTSTRRRRAARPAGPPATPDADTPDARADAPAAGDDDREPAADDSEHVDSEHVDAAHDEEHGPSLVHVPVKKKGSRKR
jgi:ribonuclease E